MGIRALGLTALTLAAFWSGPAAGQPPGVVASIKPIHSLVAAVMAGVAKPVLLIEGGGSPHGYSLRPSQARALSRADVVFWIGPGLEAFLEKPLTALAASARVVALSRAPGVVLLRAREGGAWESAEAADEGRAGGGYNPHVWLDPGNAAAMVRAAVAALSAADPAHAAVYRENGVALVRRIDAEDRATAQALAPVGAVPYVVFHDAYAYFERRYGLRAVGSIAVGPERKPGARRIREIREKIVAVKAACVFSEPQFRPALVDAIIEGTGARAGTLDPLGADLEPGPGAYFRIVAGLVRSLKGCLSSPTAR